MIDVNEVTKATNRAIFVNDLTRAIYEIEHINRQAIVFGISWFDGAGAVKKHLYDLQEKVLTS
jgi:hypothetical protein